MPSLQTAGFKSLVAATATGAGTPTLVLGTCKYGIQVLLGGTAPATGGAVVIEGTLDGAHWFALATWTIGTQNSGDIIFAVDKPVAQIRANCTSLTGGTAPTVSAWLSAW